MAVFFLFFFVFFFTVQFGSQPRGIYEPGNQGGGMRLP